MYFCAFDILAEAVTTPHAPLSMRKATLERVLARRAEGHLRQSLSVCPPCKLGLEGLVSKRRDRLYPTGPEQNWVHVKEIVVTRQWIEAACSKMSHPPKRLHPLH